MSANSGSTERGSPLPLSSPFSRRLRLAQWLAGGRDLQQINLERGNQKAKVRHRSEKRQMLQDDFQALRLVNVKASKLQHQS